MKKIPYVAGFDSATGMLQALASFLNGYDFSGLSIAPQSLLPLGWLLNSLPASLRKSIYKWSGWLEANSVGKLAHISCEEIRAQAVSLYPQKKYPALAIGSSNGALTHLWSGLNIPWLPQTFFIPVQRFGIHVDDPQKDMEWGKKHAIDFLNANPDIQLHHMHDPVQDRLMIQKMTYFRIKSLRLGKSYENFITQSLTEEGTIFIIDCQKKWTITKVQERHYFQFGALGGAEQEEYLEGGERVENYLKDHNSPFQKWEAPSPDGLAPEAEWGFEPSLYEDIERLAQEKGYKVVKLSFQEPDDPSPLIADLYAWWYQQRGIASRSLLVESFLVMDPLWTFKIGAIPFWMLFNTKRSLERIENYLNDRPPFDEIFLSLFAHGVESIGLPSVEEWEQVLYRALKKGEFVGTHKKKFPADLAVYLQFHRDIKKKTSARYDLPPPLTLKNLKDFISTYPENQKLIWKGL